MAFDPYFLFLAPNWTPASAGVRAMHQLCHDIGVLGHRAYLSPCVQNPDLETKLWSQSVEGYGIALYPEGVHGNPLMCAVVARWLLNVQRHNFVDMENDLFFSWAPAFNRPDVECIPLHVPVIDEKSFYPPEDPMQPRTLKCFYARKFRHGGGIVPEEIEETHIDLLSVAHGDKDTLRSIFQQSDHVLLFEESSISDEAMLCGCRTVYWKDMLTPDNDITYQLKDYKKFKRSSEFMVRQFIDMCLERALCA